MITFFSVDERSLTNSLHPVFHMRFLETWLRFGVLSLAADRLEDTWLPAFVRQLPPSLTDTWRLFLDNMDRYYYRNIDRIGVNDVVSVTDIATIGNIDAFREARRMSSTCIAARTSINAFWDRWCAGLASVSSRVRLFDRFSIKNAVQRDGIIPDNPASGLGLFITLCAQHCSDVSVDIYCSYERTNPAIDRNIIEDYRIYMNNLLRNLYNSGAHGIRRCNLYITTINDMEHETKDRWIGFDNHSFVFHHLDIFTGGRAAEMTPIDLHFNDTNMRVSESNLKRLAQQARGNCSVYDR